MAIATAHSPLPIGLPNVDLALRRGIEQLTSKDSNFWDFKSGGRSEYDQAPFQYPAMMVPALQREIVTLIGKLQPCIETVADPFVGSGTVLCEAMLLGKSFVGQDINPLAVLISRMRFLALNVEKLSSVFA